VKQEQPDVDLENLFEDIGILVEWALKRLPIVPPKEKENEKVS